MCFGSFFFFFCGDEHKDTFRSKLLNTCTANVGYLVCILTLTFRHPLNCKVSELNTSVLIYLLGPITQIKNCHWESLADTLHLRKGSFRQSTVNEVMRIDVYKARNDLKTSKRSDLHF